MKKSLIHPTISVKPVTSISEYATKPMQKSKNLGKSSNKLIISHGDTHPFGEKCKTCDKIKKEFDIDMGIKDKNSLHNRIHKEGFKAGYKKGVKLILSKWEDAIFYSEDIDDKYLDRKVMGNHFKEASK